MFVKVASCDLYVNPEKIVKIRQNEDSPNKIEIHFDKTCLLHLGNYQESATQLGILYQGMCL